MASSTSSAWGTAGWWIIVALSVPFAVYASVFAYGDFDVYRQFTVQWLAQRFDVAGRNIQEHIRVWQVHSLGAILFVVLGAFQFNRHFRKTYPKAHGQMGYGFVAVATAMAVEGIFMVWYSEFGLFTRAVFFLQGCFMPPLLFKAVWTARQKRFHTHQKYMIRGAATGYAMTGVRVFVFLFHVAGVEVWRSADLGAITSVVVFVGLAEIYIQTVLGVKPGGAASLHKRGNKKIVRS